VIVVKESFTLIKDVLASRNGNGNGKECSKGVEARLTEIKQAQEVRGAAEAETTRAKIKILEGTRDLMREMSENIAVLVDRAR
jgi:hypothetical protein